MTIQVLHKGTVTFSHEPCVLNVPIIIRRPMAKVPYTSITL